MSALTLDSRLRIRLQLILRLTRLRLGVYAHVDACYTCIGIAICIGICVLLAFSTHNQRTEAHILSVRMIVELPLPPLSLLFPLSL